METENIKQNYLKAILLIGEDRTGKSRLANLFIKGKKHDILHLRNNQIDNSFLFATCDADTEVIVFDDFNLFKNDLEKLFSWIENGVIVNKKMQAPFKIHPQIIITINCKMENLPLGDRLDSLFDVFELNACN